MRLHLEFVQREMQSPYRSQRFSDVRLPRPYRITERSEPLSREERHGRIEHRLDPAPHRVRGPDEREGRQPVAASTQLEDSPHKLCRELVERCTCLCRHFLDGAGEVLAGQLELGDSAMSCLQDVRYSCRPIHRCYQPLVSLQRLTTSYMVPCARQSSAIRPSHLGYTRHRQQKAFGEE